MRRGNKRAMAGAIALALALVLPGSALAGEGYVQAGHAEFDAYAGETNDLTVSQSGASITFSDVVPIDAGSGCVRGASNRSVVCNNGFGRPEISLGNGSDDLQPSTLHPLNVGLYVDGNAGVDLLVGTAQPDVLLGGWGADVLRGAAGNDTLEGNDGNDFIHGDAGADLMEGGWHDDELDGDDNAPGDTLDCGPGDDLAVYNPGDTVLSNCERTRLAP
jgi:Ca2+-binding RTX toxin-like protein